MDKLWFDPFHGGEDFDEAASEVIEFVRLRNMTVQGGGIELGEQVDTSEARVDAVGNRDINDAIFAG